MGFLLYYLFIKPLSLLPLSITYFLSDILYFFLAYLGVYRKKIAISNLTRSFPDKSPKEIERFTKLFFRHFCDVIIENLHFFSISESEIRRRFVVSNPELLDDFYQKNQSVILIGGHYHNWEVSVLGFNLMQKHQGVGVYRPLSDPFFNQKMQQNRSKFGLELVTKWDLIKVFHRKNETPVMTLIMADQAPTNDKRRYWTRFLNQDTAMIVGTERFARMFDLPVIYVHSDKTKRGHYQISYEVLELSPKTKKTGEITEKYARMLEHEIQKEPQYWLWTHRRWKQKRTDAQLYQIEKVK